MSRQTTEPDKPAMMLVRTEAGYEPMAVARYNDYVWDQPLHPERERDPVHRRTAADRPATPPPPTTVVERPQNGSGHGLENGEHPTHIAAHVEAAPAVSPEPAPTPVALPASGERVTISRKAVALGIALVVGLPLGSRALSGGGDAPAATRRSAAGAVAGKPAALVALSGFEQLGPDAVRYAVVVTNPNKAYEASGVTVSIVVHDAGGRLVGSDTERVAVVPASGAMGVAGAVGVSGPAARMTVKVGTSAFEETASARSFLVRDVRLTRTAEKVVVRARVSGIEAAGGTRVVAVYLDRSGKVVGGDFTYVDVPRAPASVAVVISTSGVRRKVARVQVYVIPPR